MSSHYRPDSKKKLDWITPDETKKDTLVIKPIALDVTWGKDDRYWIIPKAPGDSLELRQVAWLEVSCTFPVKHLIEKLGLLQNGEKKFRVNFTVSLKPESAFGWASCPVFLMAKVAGKSNIWRRVDLSKLEKGKRAEENKVEIPPEATPLTFTISKDDPEDADLTLGLYEIWKGRWKGGLVIHQVTIRPI